MKPTGILKANDTSGPAFPVGADEGMTLRDYFAAKAMAALIAQGQTYAPAVAARAYEVAESMLAERVK